jgi:hypothetical protein
MQDFTECVKLNNRTPLSEFSDTDKTGNWVAMPISDWDILVYSTERLVS